MPPSRFNVRIYGLLVNPAGEVLVTDEIRGGYRMTKFPGGGLDFGEGVADCLRREFREETGQDVHPGEIFYLNDFLQISAFNPQDQLLSVYYRVHADDYPAFAVVNLPFDGADAAVRDAQYFRWVPVQDLRAAEFTFPIDKIVAEKLLNLAHSGAVGS